MKKLADHIYSAQDFELEKSLVFTALRRRTERGTLPVEYEEEMKPYVEKIYSLTEFKANTELMLSSPLIIQAYEFAMDKHFQVRKHIKIPYIYHLMEVAARVSTHGGSAEDIAVSFLHDVVEDCQVSISEIEQRFGGTIAKKVNHLTDIAKLEDGTREERLAINIAHMQASPLDVKVIKMCDLLSNIRTIALLDAQFAKSFVPGQKLILNALKKDEEHIEHPLMKTLDAVQEQIEKVLLVQAKYDIIKREQKFKEKVKKRRRNERAIGI